MHPYQMQRVMAFRGKEDVIRVQRGSLYPAVERLAQAGLIESTETAREGRRPERTVYRLTEQGRETASQWLGDMLSDPKNEFPRFPAALAFLPMLSPGQARAALTTRALGLARAVAALGASERDLLERFGMPRLFLLEDEYRRVVLQAELDWVRSLVDDLGTGGLDWDQEWLERWAAGLEQRMGAMPGGPYPATRPSSSGARAPVTKGDDEPDARAGPAP